MKTSHPAWRLVLGTLVIGVLSACGSSTRDQEYYGAMPLPALDATTHKHGYGRRDCLVCHNSSLNIHRDAGTVIDADALNAAAKANGQSNYCMTCHGTNGT